MAVIYQLCRRLYVSYIRHLNFCRFWCPWVSGSGMEQGEILEPIPSHTPPIPQVPRDNYIITIRRQQNKGSRHTILS
jgi:hypothetical protein